VTTITGTGDHDRLDWLITMTGIRTSVGKRASLSDFAAVKHQPAASKEILPQPGEAPELPATTEAASEKRKGQTLRLRPPAWRQLRMLAVELDTDAHKLLVESVNDLFRKYGKPPIA
jgi:hypothetical protein